MDAVKLDTLTIDPVTMNLVNRVAAGSRLKGSQEYQGGVLVQGSLEGVALINGRLIVWAGGTVSGHLRVMGDMFVFGRVGHKGGNPQDTLVECLGTIYVAATGISTGTLMARRLRLYEGADLIGPFKTLPASATLPALAPGENA